MLLAIVIVSFDIAVFSGFDFGFGSWIHNHKNAKNYYTVTLIALPLSSIMA